MSKTSAKITAIGGLGLVVFGFVAWSQYQHKQALADSVAKENETATRAVIDTVTDNARGRRNVARDLREQSDARVAAKDYAGAMDARLQILNYDKPKISNLGALSFYATQQLALQDIAPIASHLDAATARRYATQLEQRDAKLFTYQQLLTDEKADELKQVDRYFKTPTEWQKAIEGLDFSTQEKAVLRKTSTAQVKTNIAAYYDQLIKNAGKPYNSAAQKPTVALDPYSKNYATSYAPSRFLWAKAKTQRVLIVAALQARADRLENQTNSAPLPLDPFGRGPLQRRGTTIYSVGPDTVNDGGAPVANPNRVQPTDKGDILAPTL